MVWQHKVEPHLSQVSNQSPTSSALRIHQDKASNGDKGKGKARALDVQADDIPEANASLSAERHEFPSSLESDSALPHGQLSSPQHLYRVSKNPAKAVHNATGDCFDSTHLIPKENSNLFSQPAARHSFDDKLESGISFRPTHNRARSSLGSANVYDFFGPSSVKSSSTVATSVYHGSSKPIASSNSSSEEEGRHDSLNISQLEPITSYPEAVLAQPTQLATGQATSRSEPPTYFDQEALPKYEEVATVPSAAPSPGQIRSRQRSAQNTIASRFLLSRMAQRFLPGTSQMDGATSSAPPTPNNEPETRRGTLFAQSGSVPNLPRLGARVEMRTFAATDYVQGARMGPTPRRNRNDSLNPRRAGSGSSQRQVGDPPRGSVSRNHTQSLPYMVFPTSVSSRPTSRQGASRPGSGAASFTESSRGIYTCGSSTPNQLESHKKNRSRHLSLRNLSDLLLHRDRDRPNSTRAGHHATTGPACPSPARASLDLTLAVSSNDQVRVNSSDAIVPRPIAQSATPSLMRPAYSSAQATVTTTSTSNPWLVFPIRQRLSNPFEKLPRELIILCFKTLIELHVSEHDANVAMGIWRGKKSYETKWVGIESAVQELARLSRVCKAWQSYVLDGQLWKELNVSAFSHITQAGLLRLVRSAGPFIRTLNLQGLSTLSSEALVCLFDAQVKRQGQLDLDQQLPNIQPVGVNGLTELNLEGCHSVCTEALNHVLSQSPLLTNVNLRNLACATNDTLAILGNTAAGLEWLDISRCGNVDAGGICMLALSQGMATNVAAVKKERNMASTFKGLRAAGLKGSESHHLMKTLGMQWPHLEALDLSYASFLNDAAVEAFVSSENDVFSEKGLYVELSPRQAGVPGDDVIVRRTFPCLKKFNLSSCRLLTDRACVYLSHTVPKLEVLELANIGAPLKDTGLVKLLSTVPHLKKLDLEGASHITDAVLTALTPPVSHAEAYGVAAPLGGAAMTMMSAMGGGGVGPSSILGRARRSQSTSRGQERPPTDPPRYDEDAVASLIPATGTELTHLVLSSANQLSVAALALLVHRCPALSHLELDDTRAGDSLAREFVYLAKMRKYQKAHISLIDSTSLCRTVCQELANLGGPNGGTRPRSGERGWAFRHFGYDDAEAIAALSPPTSTTRADPTSTTTTSPDTLTNAPLADTNHQEARAGRTSLSSLSNTATVRAALGNDECNSNRVVLKSFWGWQNVDARIKARRKAEAKAAKQSKRRHQTGAGNSPTAEISSRYPTTRGPARWSRILIPAGAMNNDDDDDDDDDDDPRGCTVM